MEDFLVKYQSEILNLNKAVLPQISNQSFQIDILNVSSIIYLKINLFCPLKIFTQNMVQTIGNDLFSKSKSLDYTFFQITFRQSEVNIMPSNIFLYQKSIFM